MRKVLRRGAQVFLPSVTVPADNSAANLGHASVDIPAESIVHDTTQELTILAIVRENRRLSREGHRHSPQLVGDLLPTHNVTACWLAGIYFFEGLRASP
jgi:hypothetical protein